MATKGIEMKKTGHIGNGHLAFPTADQLPHIVCAQYFDRSFPWNFVCTIGLVSERCILLLQLNSPFHGLAKLFLHVRMATKSMASYIITNLNILLSVSWPELLLYPMKQKSIYISSFHALKSKSATAAAGQNKIGFKKSPLCFSKYHQSICNLWPIQKFCQNILRHLQHHRFSFSKATDCLISISLSARADSSIELYLGIEFIVTTSNWLDC